MASRTLLTMKSKIEMFKILPFFTVEQVLKDPAAWWQVVC
jgi:hypothetical protein